MNNMDKVYNPQAIEGELYREWEESGAFTAHRVEGKKPFTIVMPPPNITGQLHMGITMVNGFLPSTRCAVNAPDSSHSR